MPACEFPEISEGQIAGETVYYMTGEGFLLQAACQETARANHDIALQNAIALDKLRQAYGELAKQGAAQRDLAEYYLGDLEERRRATSVELWTYKGLLALVGVVAIL